MVGVHPNPTVAPGATWGLYVNARDAAGNASQASPTVTITVPQCQADTQPPTSPTGVTATAGQPLGPDRTGRGDHRFRLRHRHLRRHGDRH